MLIERDPDKVEPDRVPQAEWLQADACELASLEEAGCRTATWSISATGDDKVNLVVSLLAKTEFAVRRVVARINHPDNEWLFTEAWGVDVAVSTPRVLAALVEEAVSVGDLVRLMTFRQGQANLVEITLPTGAPVVGRPVRDMRLPRDAALVAIVRGVPGGGARPGRAAGGGRRAAVRRRPGRRGRPAPAGLRRRQLLSASALRAQPQPLGHHVVGRRVSCPGCSVLRTRRTANTETASAPTVNG